MISKRNNKIYALLSYHKHDKIKQFITRLIDCLLYFVNCFSNTFLHDFSNTFLIDIQKICKSSDFYINFIVELYNKIVFEGLTDVKSEQKILLNKHMDTLQNRVPRVQVLLPLFTKVLKWLLSCFKTFSFFKKHLSQK